MKKRTISPLMALTTAALSLPVFAASAPLEKELSLSAASYQEDDLTQAHIILGSEERYDIDIFQFRLLTPLNRDFSLELSASHESMTGASPWSSVQGVDGEPSLVMTGATIKENRTQVGATVTRYEDNSSFAIGFSHSKEDDYEATALSLNAEWDLSNKLSTLAIGLSYSNDDIKPSDAIMFARVERESRRSISASINWTQVLNKNSLIQVGTSFTQHKGFLSDPYKLRDVRPGNKLEWASSLRYRKYFDQLNGAWHFDYRYYTDAYDVHSHTFYTAWYQNISPYLQLVPNVRYYSQDEAGFYSAFDDFALPLTQNQSSDFRLSTFGALTFGMKAIVRLNRFSINFSLDKYISDENYALTNSEFEHPALLDYTLISMGIDVRF